jgi:hypothetical protein
MVQMAAPDFGTDRAEKALACRVVELGCTAVLAELQERGLAELQPYVGLCSEIALRLGASITVCQTVEDTQLHQQQMEAVIDQRLPSYPEREGFFRFIRALHLVIDGLVVCSKEAAHRHPGFTEAAVKALKEMFRVGQQHEGA